MPDFPWMPFYTGDWMSDPKLAMCQLSTVGFWINAISAMHSGGRTGELIGTVEQIARACHCSPTEAVAAIADLKANFAADVTDRNGLVTLINRRMKRENDKRKANNERQKRHRSESATQNKPRLSRSENKSVTDTRASDQSPESESEPEEEASQTQPLPKGTHTTQRVHARMPDDLAAALSQVAGIGIPEKFTEEVWGQCEARGFVDGANVPIHSWKKYAAHRWRQEQSRIEEEKQKGKNGNTHQRPAGRSNGRGDAPNRNAGTFNSGNTSDYSRVGAERLAQFLRDEERSKAEADAPGSSDVPA